MSGTPHRYALIGAGSRATMYVDAILERRDRAELVALVDTNAHRIGVHADAVEAAGAPAPAGYAASDFDRMLAEVEPDTIIITSVDATHHEYLLAALAADLDVICEKPLTTTGEHAAAILAAEERSAGTVTVTFNYRYNPLHEKVADLLREGVIGEIISVGFDWLLDTRHGADYFRRWHRRSEHSGGLLIHKSGHHFDLVNWWIADTPQRVFASGGTKFYGSSNAERYGFTHPNPRGTHDNPERTPFELDLRSDERLKELYLDNEHHDGYLRDQDVFGDGITTEDTLAVIVDYAGGPVLSYSLVAHAPWEGYRVSINGTRGRAELDVVERPAVLLDEDTLDPSAIAEATGGRQRGHRLTVQNHWEGTQEVEITEGRGGHGGGDALLLADLFRGPGDDPLGRPSDWLDGLRSAGVGMAGNEALRTGHPVRIDDLGFGVDLARAKV